MKRQLQLQTGLQQSFSVSSSLSGFREKNDALKVRLSFSYFLNTDLKAGKGL